MTGQPAPARTLATLPRAALMALTAALLPDPAAAEPAPRVVTGFAHPESVVIDGDRRFVSNIGAELAPLARDGDGFISEMAADGTLVERRALPGAGDALNAPKGMAVVGGTLYVTDIDRVVGFDIDSRRRVFEAALPEGDAVFANDLAVLGDATLLVSDTLRGLVFRLDLATGGFTPWAAGVPGANGLAHDPIADRTMVAGLGADFGGGDLFAITGDGTATALTRGPLGILDGLVLLPGGDALVSDWVALGEPVQGRLWRLPADGGTPAVVCLDAPLHGPADFDYDAATGTLWIPATMDGAVVIAPYR
ncbi:hypothetical protein L2U69_12820 [Zavarzinia compransoris]|uniref:hypothetical protein n=1 Tax=Zavarzinia marina TaxID=2911065 RepID=UPI001F1D80F0|nr:hypothetical protein [Zavarzinia marina]MCF4166529.1 hypothetical protein [Zavarzinia marina]